MVVPDAKAKEGGRSCLHIFLTMGAHTDLCLMVSPRKVVNRSYLLLSGRDLLFCEEIGALPKDLAQCDLSAVQPSGQDLPVHAANVSTSLQCPPANVQ